MKRTALIFSLILILIIGFGCTTETTDINEDAELTPAEIAQEKANLIEQAEQMQVFEDAETAKVEQLINEYDQYVQTSNEDFNSLALIATKWNTIREGITVAEDIPNDLPRLEQTLNEFKNEYNLIKNHNNNFRTFLNQNEQTLRDLTTIDMFTIRKQIDDFDATIQNIINDMENDLQYIINFYNQYLQEIESTEQITQEQEQTQEELQGLLQLLMTFA